MFIQACPGRSAGHKPHHSRCVRALLQLLPSLPGKQLSRLKYWNNGWNSWYTPGTVVSFSDLMHSWEWSPLSLVCLLKQDGLLYSSLETLLLKVTDCGEILHCGPTVKAYFRYPTAINAFHKLQLKLQLGSLAKQVAVLQTCWLLL